MKEMKEKIKKEIYSKKIVVTIVIITFLLGLLFGSIYITILDNSSKKEVINSVNNYMYNFNNITFSSKLSIFKNDLIKNFLFFGFIWVLGLSIIGVPIIIICDFIKSFIVGFSISGIFACFKFKGIIGILIYLIPVNIILISLILILPLPPHRNKNWFTLVQYQKVNL